ncbi:MAG: glycoside hydrolase family 36 protein [Kiritimatiellia bacterium]
MSEPTRILLTESTAFARADKCFWLARLCGLAVGREGVDSGPNAATGVALLTVDGQRYEAGQLVFEHAEETPAAVTSRWQVGQTPLRLTAVWAADRATGVVSRQDSLHNTGHTPLVLSRCLARLSLPPGHYECYTQASRWCRENQGAWQPLHTGSRQSHLSGRTTEGGTPYLAIRLAGAEQGLAFHVLPRGNWTIRVTPVVDGGERPFAVVELGLADDNLHRVLQPGETFALPEILIQPLPQGQPHLAAPALHRYLLSRHYVDAKPQAPVIFNTWFDQFEILDVPRLRTQLAAAKEVGCELFVIDAGWYGAGGPDWGAQTGDWREKTEAAFCGRMRAFADEVRAAGLGFGIWMEPERFGAQAPIRAEHPEWFVAVGAQARMDLTQPAAYAWLRGEIGRLVETYQLAWMKIDFNFRLDTDASGAELADYTAAWHRMLNEVRAAYPATFFEGCSSGAMRCDLEMMRHVDGHFLSDTVNPTDMLRIMQGAWLRLPPGRIGHWTVIRSVEHAVCDYCKTQRDSAPVILVPGGGIWNAAESVGLDFALLAALPGMLGFSGDFAGLNAAQRARVAEAIIFFKQWRKMITGAVGHLLTPPQLIESREGWIAFQLQSLAEDTSLVLVYRLGATGCLPALRLQGIVPSQRYALQWGFSATAKSDAVDGETLLREGLPLHSDIWSNRAAVCVVRAV